MRFEFATATRIVFGPGTVREVAPLARELGSRVLLVTGQNQQRSQGLIDELRNANVAVVPFFVAGEPTVDAVEEGLELARTKECNLVIAFGGGSAIDAGKAIAALITNGGKPLDYLEVIGAGKPITQPSAPCIAIPTTAGTGAEVTRNAVLASPKHMVKASLRSPLILPRIAVVDPELTYHLPRAITASTGLDALTQLIEPYVSHRANPLTDALCVEGLQRAARSLRKVCDEKSPLDDAMKAARTDMAIASLHGGFALANAALGAVHGFAAPIGGGYTAPHGAVCAALLPQVMETNLRALRQRSPSSVALHRYDCVAQILTGNATATAEAGVEWVRALCRDLSIRSLRAYDVSPDDVPDLVKKGAVASSMKGNPIALTPAELEEILTQSL
jgi:alcohol dehydrogenase class IV